MTKEQVTTRATPSFEDQKWLELVRLMREEAAAEAALQQKSPEKTEGKTTEQKPSLTIPSPAIPVEKKEWTAELLAQERDAWQRVLGTEVEIKPLPSMVTPEVRKNLERLGFGLRYIPRLNLGTIDDLKRQGEGNYLYELQRRYPSWRRYESLSNTERGDHSVGRNLEDYYWKHVKDGIIDFPRLAGVWLAVETMPKPPCGDSYKKTPVIDIMGLSDRFNVSWKDAQAVIKKAKQGILSEAGLPSSLEMRMLETLEWNLLANREGWGATDSFEWTNTEYHGAGESLRGVAGDSCYGGAAYARWNRPGFSHGFVGFRLAVVLGS